MQVRKVYGQRKNHQSIDKSQYYCTTELIDHTISVSWAPNYAETIQNPLSPSSPSTQWSYLTASKFDASDSQITVGVFLCFLLFINMVYHCFYKCIPWSLEKCEEKRSERKKKCWKYSSHSAIQRWWSVRFWQTVSYFKNKFV